MRWKTTGAAVLIVAAAAVSVSLAQQAATSTKPQLDPAAMSALDRMGTYLRTIKVFHVDCRTTRDEVLDDGQTIQVNGTADLLVKTPDKLRARVDTDLKTRSYFYDGKTFTLYGERLGFYATAPAPPTLRQLVDVLDDKYDIEIPLADLFLWGTDESTASQITAATDFGPSEVDGTACEHYAYRQPGVDWQVWLQQGANPLPRRIVIINTDDSSLPQYSSTLKWDLAPAYNDEAFTFYPPKDANKIVFAADRQGK
jgi:hypothetical protein